MQYFSPSKIAFINLVAWPDCIQVSPEVFKEIDDKINAKTHTLGVKDGQPVAVPIAPPAEPTVQELFEQRLAELNQDYETHIRALHATFPESETKSWVAQVAEAKAIIATPSGADLPNTPFLTPLLARRNAGGFNETLTDLAVRVLDMDAYITPRYSDTTGKRHVAERQLTIALQNDDIAALKTVAWDLTPEPIAA